jgi:hypothetical protein
MSKSKTSNTATPSAVAKGKRLPIKDIPEVQEYTDLRNELDSFNAEHPEVFTTYADLADRVNTAMEAAEKAVRSQGVSCGPFENFSVTVVYDPVKMFEELGEDLFLQCGGSKSTVTELRADPKLIEVAIANKKIPDECIDHFRSIRRSYHKPDKVGV